MASTAMQILRKLQATQREHDMRAHRDIYYLSYPERMKHLALHVAKYVGRLSDREHGREAFERTLVDTFIVALSATEVLNIDYGDALTDDPRCSDCNDLRDLGGLLVQQTESAHVYDWYFRELARIGGAMAKACESLDHMEAIPYREMLTDAVVELGCACLAAASQTDLELDRAVHDRWAAIEQARVL